MSMVSEKLFHVGDRAWYVSGGYDVEVEVIEERGPLGVGGRHLVRILVPQDYAEPLRDHRPRGGAPAGDRRRLMGPVPGASG